MDCLKVEYLLKAALRAEDDGDSRSVAALLQQALEAEEADLQDTRDFKARMLRAERAAGVGQPQYHGGYIHRVSGI
jgi:hypothetical protein